MPSCVAPLYRRGLTYDVPASHIRRCRCKAKTQECDGAPSGGGRRLHAPAEYAQGDCCDGLYCINSLTEGAVCVSKTTNPAILSATPATTASGTTIDVQVAPSSDEGASTIALREWNVGWGWGGVGWGWRGSFAHDC